MIRYKKNKKAFAWTYSAVQPGYHQNKEHWNTIILDATVPEKEIRRMIAESYDLIVGKKNGRSDVYAD